MTLSQTIASEITRWLTSRRSLPCALKLMPLAAHFSCSTRPVRQALAQLREQGLLSPEKLATLTINEQSDSDAVSSKAASTQTPAQATLNQLTKQLIEQSLHAGDQEVFVRETTVAKKLQTSTTVVREHFSRLVGYGLLEHIPRRGWRLRPVRQKDLDDFIHVRLSLETLALSIAWDKLDHAMIKNFFDNNTLARKSTSKLPAKPASTDNQFHRYIIDVADNFYIRDFFDRQGRFFQLLFEWEDQAPATTAQTVRQHRLILKSILQNDQPKAQAALKIHILDNHPLLTTILKDTPPAKTIRHAKSKRQKSPKG